MPRVRTDVADVYLFRRRGGRVEFLQLLRTAGEHGGALGETWQPIMGHINDGETAAACMEREMREEVGLASDDSALLGFWALEQVHPFYLAKDDAIMLSPRFAAEVSAGWQPRLNEEHTDHRWIDESEVDRMFMWPGQRACCREILARS